MKNWLFRVYDLYVDGFRSMTVGKTLWTILIIKLIVIFCVLKLFFFHDYIGENAQEGQEAEFVFNEIINNPF